MSMEKMKGKFTSPEPDFSKMRSYWAQFPMLVNQVSIWSSNKKKNPTTQSDDGSTKVLHKDRDCGEVHLSVQFMVLGEC